MIAQSFQYDAIGNMKAKGVGGSDSFASNYKYGAAGGTGPGPHAVTDVTVQGIEQRYQYDANGNVEQAGDRSITWSSFNKPVRISDGSNVSTFAYGPDRARYVHQRQDSDGSATTWYIGGAYERIESDGTATHRYNIRAGGQVVAIQEIETEADAAADTLPTVLGNHLNFLHRDHLGSVRYISDEQGDSVGWQDFGAYGEQRDVARIAALAKASATDFSKGDSGGDTISLGGAGVDISSAFLGQLFAPVWNNFHRGYTGHESLDHLGLIHMNGRIYDPAIGRFLSADPFVQFPESTQGFNRYTYVGNNPLSATDPSGYFSLKKELGKALGHVAGYLSFIPGCQIWCSAIAGAVSGYLLTGNLTGAAFGAAGGALAGFAQNGANLFDVSGFAVKTVSAIGAGVLSVAGGGRFGDGFLGSVAGGLSSNPFIAAAIGGTVSKIGGGKFANGARSAFFHAAIGPSLAGSLSGGIRDGGAGFFQNLWDDVKTAFGVVDTREMTASEVSKYYPDPENAPGEGFDTQKQAATVALDGMLSATGNTGWEWAASIRRLPNNKWTFDVPVTSHLTTRVYADRILLPGYEGLAHTHPVSSSFSTSDYMLGRARYVDMWLTGPNGNLHHWWPAKFEGPEGYKVYPGTFEPLWER